MRRTAFVLLATCSAAAAQTKELPWTQWGCPNRNFQTTSPPLADKWPAAGPRVLWKRPLGEGYSSILVENGVLYTMYGKPGEEVTLAAKAHTGQTIWERSNPVRCARRAAYPTQYQSRTFSGRRVAHSRCADRWCRLLRSRKVPSRA